MARLSVQESIPYLSSAGSRFRHYSPEREEISRLQKVSEGNGVVAKLREIFQDGFKHDAGDFVENYPRALSAIKGMQYTPKDVFLFSVSLESFQDAEQFNGKAGWFLSAIINNSSHKRFIIFTQHLAEGLDYLGYQNCRSIVVKGDVGFGCATEMKSGRIVIEGNSGDDLASWMSGGIVNVKGDAGSLIGTGLRGGEVHLLGGYESIGGSSLQPCGGRIYLGKRKILDGLWGAEDVRYG